MIISKHKTLDVQPLLWDQPLGNHGHCRTVIGDLIEELTAVLVSGKRHKTQSTADYCPDISSTDEQGTLYTETKAVGQSKTAFIYAGRLEKDQGFVEQEFRLRYIIWHHKANTKLAVSVGGLRTLVLQKMQSVFLVPFYDISSICSNLKIETLNSQYGRSSGDRLYGSGYRIPLSLLRSGHLLLDKEGVQKWLWEIGAINDLLF